jgi:hypothetical protein
VEEHSVRTYTPPLIVARSDDDEDVSPMELGLHLSEGVFKALLLDVDGAGRVIVKIGRLGACTFGVGDSGGVDVAPPSLTAA